MSVSKYTQKSNSSQKYSKAEKIYQRALQGYEKAWGPEHTSTLDTVKNLGILYKNLGQLDEAEKMYQRELRAQHPSNLLLCTVISTAPT
jgi:tetratricopeptide (TPR) repeat protein